MRTARALDHHEADFKIGMTQLDVAPDGTLAFLSMYSFWPNPFPPRQPVSSVRALDAFSRISSLGGLARIVREIDAQAPLKAWLAFVSRPVSRALPQNHVVYRIEAGSLDQVELGLIRDGIVLELLEYETDASASVVLIGWEDAL